MFDDFLFRKQPSRLLCYLPRTRPNGSQLAAFRLIAFTRLFLFPSSSFSAIPAYARGHKFSFRNTVSVITRLREIGFPTERPKHNLCRPYVIEKDDSRSYSPCVAVHFGAVKVRAANDLI